MAQYRDIELRLIESETQVFAAQGMAPGKARATAVALVDRATALARSRGRYGRGPLGDWMLGNPGYAPYFAWARQYYGVRDADIREWWDLDEVERALVQLDDDMAHMAGFINALDNGMSEDQAAASVWHALPYCDFDFGRQASDKHRAPLLPAELKPRIVAYVERCARDGLPLDHTSATFNDWVRDAAVAGIL